MLFPLLNAALVVPLALTASGSVGQSSHAPALTPVPASELSASFAVASPEAEGLDSAKLAALPKWVHESKAPIFSVLISRDGKLVFELYTSSLPRDDAHYVMSVTKSITSALIGEVIDHGLIAGTDDSITKYLPHSLFTNPADINRLGALSIKNVLGMSALDASEPPHDRSPEAVQRGKDLTTVQNRVAYALTQKLLPAPGTSFQYNDVTPLLATGLIQYTTGMSELQYAQKTLFGPLGFRNVEWMHQDPAGTDNGAYGLRLRPLDMQKFGLLYLNKGTWNGKQVISRSWVEKSFQPWIRSQPKVAQPNYGWYWWREGYGNGWQAHVANGWKGQRIIVIPSEQLVVTITADIEDNDAEDPTIATIIRDYIMPATSKTRNLPPNPAGVASLSAALGQVYGENHVPPKAEARMIPSAASKQAHRDFSFNVAPSAAAQRTANH